MSNTQKTTFDHHRPGRLVRGFTLAEVIIAMAIMSSSFLAVFGALRHCSGANSGNRRLTESVLLAEKLLNELKMNSRDVSYSQTSGQQGIYSWQITTRATGKDNLAAVRVQIQWQDRQRIREYTLYSLVRIPLIEGG